LKETLFILEL